MEKNENVVRRDRLLILTAALLAATLQLALPNLSVEVPGAETESLQAGRMIEPGAR